jgi:5-methylcytosine-specific restriction endonuclease McrA
MKKTPLKHISTKKQKQVVEERKLKKQLLERCQGKCECGCNRYPTEYPFVLDKHEIIFRSHGGDPLDPENCVILRRDCHDRQLKSGILIPYEKVNQSIVKSYSKETQLHKKK